MRLAGGAAHGRPIDPPLGPIWAQWAPRDSPSDDESDDDYGQHCTRINQHVAKIDAKLPLEEPSGPARAQGTADHTALFLSLFFILN